MKKMICAVTLAALAASQAVQAGALWIGLHGGPSIPRLSSGDNEISRGYSSRLAPNFGLLAEYTLTDHLALQLGVDYSGQGGVRDGVQPITQSPAGLPPLPPGQYLYGDFKNESVLNYLEIPLMLKWQWELSEHWRCFVEGGAFLGFLLDAEERTRGTSPVFVDQNRTPLAMNGQPLPPVSFDANTDVKSDLNEVNWGIIGGVGVAYLFNPQHQLLLDLRGEYGLRAVQKDTATNRSPGPLLWALLLRKARPAV
ncbi:MAG: porin family protein [Kiritimatiellaeota bacterium]|nr:porin family protein [Kiritimatiellota bacterium]